MFYNSAILFFLDDIIRRDHTGVLEFNPFAPGYMRDVSAVHGRLIALTHEVKHITTQELESLKFPRIVVVCLSEDVTMWDLRRTFDLDFSKCKFIGPESRMPFCDEYKMRYYDLDRKLKF